MAILGVVLIFVLGVLVGKFPEWTGGIDSAFIVYGLTRVIPQVAVGSPDANVSRYKTVIQIVNEGTTAATISSNFCNEDGTASSLILKTNLTALPTFPGSFTCVTLPANGLMVTTKSLSLGAGGHTAAFAREFFGLTGEGSGTNYSFMTFESAPAQFAATAATPPHLRMGVLPDLPFAQNLVKRHSWIKSFNAVQSSRVTLSLYHS